MNRATFFYWSFRTLLAWALAVVAIVVFAVTNPDFINVGNVFALMQSFAVLVLVGSGLALVILVGEFDLSIAGVFPLSALIAVKLSDATGTLPAILVALLVALCFGFVNGWVTSTFRIPSLAVTVGSMVLAIGIGFAIAAGQLVQAKDFSAGLLLTERVVGIFSMQSLLEIALAVLLLLFVKRSWFGRYVYAVGSNADRARASGLPVKATTIATFMISALFTGIGGALQGTTLATGTAGSSEAFLLQAATAAILGGMALTGGKGSLVGVIGAALLLATIANGLSLIGADIATIQLVNGSLLLVVVIIDRPLTRLMVGNVRAQPLPAL